MNRILNRLIFVVIVLLILFFNVSIKARDSGLLSQSCQLILVLTDSVNANQGWLYRFERETPGAPWKSVGKAIPVAIGRNGLAWGRGLHPKETDRKPLKKEGDGRSPAGVFTLSAVFGQIPPDSMAGLKMPYIFLKKGLECVDDPVSVYYNRMVERDTVKTVDWHSSEKMWHPGIWYRLGVMVEHNKRPVVKGAGSCIFLHNWSEPGETTAGCTAMDPANMKKIAFWLDAAKHPLLVQLTRHWYHKLQLRWELPPVTP